MKYSTSKQKINYLHETLDRELEQYNVNPRLSSNSRKDREELRYTSNQSKKPMPLKPTVFDHNIREADITNKSKQIGELQRKLMQLSKKMDNLSPSPNDSDDDEEDIPKATLNFKQKSDHANQDTARFLLTEANKQKGKYHLSYPSMHDEEEEEDSEDFETMQRIIEKKKRQIKLQENTKKPTVNKFAERINHQPRIRKNSTEAETVLKPKYSNQKSNRNQASKNSVQGKKSIRDSVTSKKSVEKPFPRQNSKRSFKSNNSLSRSHSKNKAKRDAFDNFSQKNEESLHNEQLNMAKDLKKMSNLEKEVTHYKRLVRKYKQELEDFRIMEIEFKELKKNFAKSELIRTQQKKIIETLKNKAAK